eukprot:scaffold77344_cov65-Phaeocystis_antarctica.AAC.4
MARRADTAPHPPPPLALLPPPPPLAPPLPELPGPRSRTTCAAATQFEGSSTVAAPSASQPAGPPLWWPPHAPYPSDRTATRRAQWRCSTTEA